MRLPPQTLLFKESRVGVGQVAKGLGPRPARCLGHVGLRGLGKLRPL